jgi:carboxymethylenebutenolidase
VNDALVLLAYPWSRNLEHFRFREGKVSHKHIYWDQASLLVQLGLLDSSRLPVAVRESAAKVRDASLPSNQLIERSAGKARRKK